MVCNCSGGRSHLLGYRFNPKEDELLFHFLLNRVQSNSSVPLAAAGSPIILDQPESLVDCEPYELPGEGRVARDVINRQSMSRCHPPVHSS